MKRAGIWFAAITLLFMAAGCSNGSNSNTVTPNPVNAVALVRSGYEDITQNDTIIQVTEGETLALTVKKTDGGAPSWYLWEVLDGTGYVSISGRDDLAGVTISADASSGANFATIKASAGNKDGSASITIKIEVTPNSDLKLAIDSGGTGVWTDNDATLTINNTDDLTLSVTGSVEDAAVALLTTVWAVAGTQGVVSIDADTGAVTVEGTGTTTIKVSATAAEAADPATKTITLVVKNSLENVLFAWSAADNPISGLAGSGNAWTHPNYAGFLAQKDGMQVKTFRSYGGGVNSGGAIKITNSSRLAIGQTSNTVTTGADTAATNLGGEIDLYRKQVRLTLNYANLADPGSNPDTTPRIALRVFVNQNTTSQANSMFGIGDPAACSLAVYHYNDILAMDGNTVDAGTIVLDIDTTNADSAAGGALFGDPNEAGLAKAFLCLLNQDTLGAGITFTGITLEYVSGEPAPDPLTLDVQQGGASVPSAGITIVEPVTTAALAAVTTPAADTVSWVIADTGIATVSPATGNSVTVTAGNVGTTSITVTASKAGYFTASKTFNITVQNTPIVLTVNQGGAPVGASIQMNEGDPAIALTADVDPSGATVAWESDTPAVATVSPATGASVSLAAVAAGSAKITVTATMAGYETATKTFTVSVLPSGAVVDPNVIFDWSYGDDNGPKGTFTSSGTDAYLVGTGTNAKAATMPICITSANVTDDATDKGIKIDGYNTTSGSVLLIGANAHGASGAGTVLATQPAGVFDFRTGNTDGIKISIGMEILTDGVGGRGFNVILNNSTTTAANSPLSGSSNEARIAYWATPLAAGTGVTGGASYDTGTNILTCATFTPSAFLQTNISTLETAFVGIMTLGQSGANYGAVILVKSIKIEYIPGSTPPPSSDPNVIFDWSYGDNNGPQGTFTSSGTDAYLVGTGTNAKAATMPICITSAYVTDDTTDKGIKIDGYNTTSGSVLLIGANSHGASGAGTVLGTQPDGVFDFSTGNTNGIKVSIGMEILTDGVGGRGFNVILNNSTTTAGNSPLSGSNNEARIAYWATPLAAGTGVTGGAAYNTSTNILTCATFTPSAFPQTNIQTLETAFIGIMTLGQSGANYGAVILIKSIRIELQQ